MKALFCHHIPDDRREFMEKRQNNQVEAFLERGRRFINTEHRVNLWFCKTQQVLAHFLRINETGNVGYPPDQRFTSIQEHGKVLPRDVVYLADTSIGMLSGIQ